MEISKTEALRNKRAKQLHTRRMTFTVLSFFFAVLALVLLIGWVVCLFVAELANTGKEVLLYCLCGGAAGGTVLSALFGFLFARLATSAEKRELDFLERCDGEESFFVGEGTLATFSDELVLHDANGEKAPIAVPYFEIRFFSVCTRKAPKEKGEWSLVMEIPARYLLKDKAAKSPPVLVQTDDKPRLRATLARRGLTVLGEQPKEGQGEKFKKRATFRLPERKRRRRALLVMLFGIVLAAAAIPVALLADFSSSAALCAVMALVGVFLCARGAVAFLRAQEIFSVYEEGLFFKSRERGESAFLKWEEIISVSEAERDGKEVLRVSCAYGGYEFPRAEGAWEYLRQEYKDKCKGVN